MSNFGLSVLSVHQCILEKTSLGLPHWELDSSAPLPKYQNSSSQTPKHLNSGDALACEILVWQMLFSLQPILTEPPVLPPTLCKGGMLLLAQPFPAALLSL